MQSVVQMGIQWLIGWVDFQKEPCFGSKIAERGCRLAKEISKLPECSVMVCRI